MNYRLVLTLNFLLFSGGALAQTPSVTDRVTKAFQERAKAELLKGVSVGFISPTEMTNLNLGDISSWHDRFEIGSISKSFAGIAIAKLSLEGKLDLEAPISNYIPELAGTFGGTVTAHLLATHSARLVDDVEGEFQLDSNKIIAFLKTYVPSAAYPAGKRQYSNVGFDTLSLLINRITGDTYEHYIQQLILNPRHMQESGFLASANVFPLLVSANDVAFFPVEKNILSDVAAGAGGIYSNIYDLNQYLILNLHPEMNANLTAAVLLSQKLGLGWDSLPGELPLWKNGAMAGYGSILKFNPTTGTGVIVLDHSRNPISATSLADIAMGGPDQFKPDLVLTTAQANSVLGKYIDEDENFEIDTTLTPAGFLNIEVTWLKLGDFYHYRLRTFDGLRYELFNGFSEGDYVTFLPDAASGRAVMHFFTFTGFDANQKPLYDELRLNPAPVQLH